MFVITGNTFTSHGDPWSGGEAIVRLQAGPTFSGNPTDFWAPANWQSLDASDTDLGGCSAILIDVPGATPSELVLALGKDGNAYLVNRNNLGGVAGPVTSLGVDGTLRGQSSATYTTAREHILFFAPRGSQIKAYKITATSPPAIVSPGTRARAARVRHGLQPPMEPITRSYGWSGPGRPSIARLRWRHWRRRLCGRGANESTTGDRKWNSGMVARGSIYVANDNKVYKFNVPGGAPRLRLHLA